MASKELSAGEARTVSVEQAGKIIGIGRNQAYEAVRRGEIPSIKIGSRILVPRVALDRMLSGETLHRARAE